MKKGDGAKTFHLYLPGHMWAGRKIHSRNRLKQFYIGLVEVRPHKHVPGGWSMGYQIFGIGFSVASSDSFFDAIIIRGMYTVFKFGIMTQEGSRFNVRNGIGWNFGRLHLRIGRGCDNS